MTSGQHILPCGGWECLQSECLASIIYGSGLSGDFGFSPGDGGDAYFEADESDPVHLLDQALGRDLERRNYLPSSNY
ncbi:hypothetical protein DH2020_021390 [Rehmannia glutinosa]|uniref:Uncharacterized protein n=1 Tax=Rehmannia glutinosa TaxID=99300 RepID=A0ABR0WEM5_REHGL